MDEAADRVGEGLAHVQEVSLSILKITPFK